MKIEIGDTIYDSDTQPIMIILDENEKQLVSQMNTKHSKFCVYPENYSEEEIKKFIKNNN